jgi:hypothetical protein
MQETTYQTGMLDTPTFLDSARAEARQADFSIDDYGREGDQRPYQIVYPAYDAPKFLQRYVDLGKALRMCKTLCTLKGRPYRVVRWERPGSGARPGGVPCAPCAGRPQSMFPRRVRSAGKNGCVGLAGFEAAGMKPVAEFHPNGQMLVFDKCGKAQVVGRPNYIVSRNPFPRERHPRALPQQYLQAVKTAQLLADRRGVKTYVCSDFGTNCKKGKQWVPIVYVQPGGLVRRYDNRGTGTTGVTPISESYFRELVAESRGATFLGQGH